MILWLCDLCSEPVHTSPASPDLLTLQGPKSYCVKNENKAKQTKKKTQKTNKKPQPTKQQKNNSKQTNQPKENKPKTQP